MAGRRRTDAPQADNRRNSTNFSGELAAAKSIGADYDAASRRNLADVVFIELGTHSQARDIAEQYQRL